MRFWELTLEVPTKPKLPEFRKCWYKAMMFYLNHLKYNKIHISDDCKSAVLQKFASQYQFLMLDKIIFLKEIANYLDSAPTLKTNFQSSGNCSLKSRFNGSICLTNAIQNKSVPGQTHPTSSDKRLVYCVSWAFHFCSISIFKYAVHGRLPTMTTWNYRVRLIIVFINSSLVLFLCERSLNQWQQWMTSGVHVYISLVISWMSPS